MSNCFPLSELKINQSGKILNFVSEDLPIKLLEMGILPEIEVLMIAKAPFKGPILIEYGEDKSRISLRLEEAKSVLIQEIV